MSGKEYRDYVAAAKINIGVDKETSIIVEKGTLVQYNGSTAIIEGEEYSFPRLSSAIKAKWLVDAEELGVDTDSSYQPQSANITMSGATPQQEDVVASEATFADEEREVSSVQAFREGDHQQTAQQQTAGRNNMPVSSQGGEAVQGVNFKTKAGSKSLEDSVRMDQLSQNAIHQMEEGVERRDKAAQFQELEKRKMEREIAALKQQLQEAEKASEPTVREGIQFRTEGISDRAAGTTRKQEDDKPEGIWDGHGAKQVGAVGEEAPAQQVQQKTQEQAAPQQKTQETVDLEDKEARLALARKMMPDFEWDFSQHWKTKLKALKDDGNPLFVCTVYAVESDAMKKHIAKQFPDLNLGS